MNNKTKGYKKPAEPDAYDVARTNIALLQDYQYYAQLLLSELEEIDISELPTDEERTSFKELQEKAKDARDYVRTLLIRRLQLLVFLFPPIDKSLEIEEEPLIQEPTHGQVVAASS